MKKNKVSLVSNPAPIPKDLIHNLSVIATKRLSALISNGSGNPQILSQLITLTAFDKQERNVAAFIEVTNDKSKEISETYITNSKQLNLPDEIGEIYLIRIIISFNELDYHDDLFNYKYISEKLTHEMTHALDNLSYEHNSDNSLEEHLSEREEAKDYISQIIKEIENETNDYDLYTLDMYEILKRSPTIHTILRELSPSDGTNLLEKRKRNARKKILTTLYVWIESRKESLLNDKNDLAEHGYKESSRKRKITSFFKLAGLDALDEFLSSNDLPVFDRYSSRELIRFVQKKLIEAGYPLPRYGADGVVGRETLRAINNFRADIGKEGVQINSDILLAQSDVSKLTHYADLFDEAIEERLMSMRSRGLREIAESIEPSRSEGEDLSGETYMFGDSQMQAIALGPFFERTYGGIREAEPGWQARNWLNDSRFLSAIDSRPSRIVFQLNSNGISGTKALLEKITDTTPNTEVIWYGAPPATLKPGSWSSAVHTQGNLDSFNGDREEKNSLVRGLLSESGLRYTFIDPFTDIPGLLNWKCSESTEPCDGIHITLSIAKKYYG